MENENFDKKEVKRHKNHITSYQSANKKQNFQHVSYLLANAIIQLIKCRYQNGRIKRMVIMLISNELDTKTTEANKELSEEEEILMYSMFIDDNNLYKNS